MSDFFGGAVILINALFMEDVLFDPELFQVLLETESNKGDSWLRIEKSIDELSGIPR